MNRWLTSPTLRNPWRDVEVSPGDRDRPGGDDGVAGTPNVNLGGDVA